MVRELVSPGVFTNEIDETELSQGLAEIGPSIIGVAEKGPAFKPINIRYWPDFQAKFGKQDPKRLGVYAARLALRTLSNINFVRVLGPADGTRDNGNTVAPGFKVDGVYGITYGSSGDEDCMAIVHTSGSNSVVMEDLTNGEFFMTISGASSVIYESTGSFNSGSDKYITKVFNSDPTQYHSSTFGYYVYRVYQHNYKNLAADPTWEANSWTNTTYGDYTMGYKSGSTPWIKSQVFGTSTEHNMFKFHTLGDGENENVNIKVTISNVRPSVSPDDSPYGTFDVIVRGWGDNDLNMNILEQFSNVSLDESSANYILKRIGDMHEEWNSTLKKMMPSGKYPVKSKYIRVEMNESVSLPETAVPWGFRGYGKMSSSIPALPLVNDLKTDKGVYSSRITWGVQFNSSSIEQRLYARPSSVADDSTDSDFSLKHVSGSTSTNYAYNTSWTGSVPTSTFSPYARFSLGFERGWDGWDIHMKDPIDNGIISDTATYASASWTSRVAFNRAVDVLSNEDEVDTDLLVIPGVYHAYVTDYALDMVEDRSDLFYPMAISGNTNTDAKTFLEGRAVDSNYAAVYYPFVGIEDTDNNKRLLVEPTTIMPYVYGRSDALGQPWYAPAGFPRTTLDDVVWGVSERLTKSERDDLYRVRINPIMKFKEGVVVWGQKNLQIKESALDRINVRRMLIKLKKAIASMARFLVFEQNAAATWQKFENRARPILQNIMDTYGIKAFKIQMNENTVTPEMEERNTMPGKIMIMPYRAAEMIPIDFILSENGASFDGA